MVRSTFYSSNQQKQADYLKVRRGEEINADKHQVKLYQKLALERGEIDQATNLAKLARNVIGQAGEAFNLGSFVDPKTKTISFNDAVLEAINKGKLGEFMKDLSNVPKSVLSTNAQVVQDVISNKDFKSNVNKKLESLVDVSKSQPKRIVSALVSEMENSPLFKRMQLSNSGNEDMPPLDLDAGLSELTTQDMLNIKDQATTSGEDTITPSMQVNDPLSKEYTTEEVQKLKVEELRNIFASLRSKKDDDLDPKYLDPELAIQSVNGNTLRTDFRQWLKKKGLYRTIR